MKFTDGYRLLGEGVPAGHPAEVLGFLSVLVRAPAGTGVLTLECA
ncbi:hypothetical protein [Streptomyces resistomycificus]|nr:hypothetical protein [Streptomyces resistomycificus]